MERAIKDLCQLPDTNLFAELAAGLGYIVENAGHLDAGARTLSGDDQHHAARVVGNLAEEEAAKGLILLDGIRCPQNRPAEKSRTLGYFYDHLAKGIYAEVCQWRPADFGEVARQVERDREEYYLDGPNDVDWIFPNRITQEREDDLYVNYVRDSTDEASQGPRFWMCPDNEAFLGFWTPPAVCLMGALHRVGATTADGLRVVAEVWRPFEPGPGTRADELERLNLRTLETLEERGLLAVDESETTELIIDRWLFPLWPLDLRKNPVDRAALREIQSNWTPDW